MLVERLHLLQEAHLVSPSQKILNGENMMKKSLINTMNLTKIKESFGNHLFHLLNR